MQVRDIQVEHETSATVLKWLNNKNLINIQLVLSVNVPCFLSYLEAGRSDKVLLDVHSLQRERDHDGFQHV